MAAKANGQVLTADQLVSASRDGLEAQAFEIPGVGTVKLRGLTRAETLAFSDMDSKDAEARFIMAGLVEPEMTEEQVRDMIDTGAAGVAVKITNRIMELSGITPTFRS